MDALLPRLPSLAGWGLAWLVVLAACLVGLRLQRRGPMLVAHAAVAVPVATLLSGALRGALGLGEVVDAALLGLGLHIAGVLLAGWGAGLAFGAWETEASARPERPGSRRADSRPARASGASSWSGSTSAEARPLVPLSALRPAAVRPVPAVGTVAARGLGRAVAAEEENRGRALLAMLEGGSAVHRAAACRALTVPFAGRRDVEVGRALLDVIDDDEGDRNVRAEAAITLGLVFDRHVSDADGLRESFEGTFDRAWLAAVRADVEGS